MLQRCAFFHSFLAPLGGSRSSGLRSAFYPKVMASASRRNSNSMFGITGTAMGPAEPDQLTPPEGAFDEDDEKPSPRQSKCCFKKTMFR